MAAKTHNNGNLLPKVILLMRKYLTFWAEIAFSGAIFPNLFSMVFIQILIALGISLFLEKVTILIYDMSMPDILAKFNVIQKDFIIFMNIFLVFVINFQDDD